MAQSLDEILRNANLQIEALQEKETELALEIHKIGNNPNKSEAERTSFEKLREEQDLVVAALRRIRALTGVQLGSANDLVAKIARLHDQIRIRFQQTEPVDPKVQKLLGTLSNTLPYLPRLKNAEINIEQAELAVGALISQSPEIEFAEVICNELERRKGVYRNPVRSIVSGRTPSTFVLLGVLSHAVVLTVAVSILSKFIPCPPSNADAVCWLPMTIAGAIGGATSVFTRLNEIAALSRWSPEGDPLQLFYTGLIKPGIGIVMGLFTYAMVHSGIVTIEAPLEAASPELNYALAFLAGFSERFVKDIIEPIPLLNKKEQGD